MAASPRYSGLRNRSGLHWAALVLLLALLGGTVAYNLFTLRHQTVKQEQNRLMTQARVIGKNIERQLGSISLALNGIVQDSAQLCQQGNQKAANKRLAVLADAMPAVRTLFITDADGTIIVANRPELVGQNFRHRAYFTAPQQQPDPLLLFISPPFKSVLGRYVFNITKVLVTPAGRFNGVVSAGFDPDYMYDIISSALYTQDMWNTINHGDGTRFMTAPHREGQAGKNLAVKGSLFSRHIASGHLESLFIDTAYATGEHRMAALLTVQPPELKMDYPLVVIISRSPKVILNGWRGEALFQGGLYLLICIGSTGVLLLVNRRQQSLEQQADRAQALVALRYQLLDYATMHSSEELLQYALDQVCELSNSPVGFYTLVDLEQQTLSLQAWSSGALERCAVEAKTMQHNLGRAGVWSEAVEQRAPVIHNDYPTVPDKKGLPPGHLPLQRELVVPVIRDEQVVAVLGVGNRSEPYTGKDAEEALYLADVLWEIIEGRRAHDELKRANQLLAEQARIDFLTGIYNRRMFDSLMTAEMTRSCRYGQPLSLLMLDIDHFKQVNDTLGHKTGDLVLQKLAELISGRIRSHDIFSRWGGEEFVILTPKCDEQQAAVLAEVLRDMVEQYNFGNGLRITVSIGVTRHLCGETAELFVNRADQALYQAKHGGRNCVKIV